MYGLDAELAKAGGRDEWEETLLEGLRDLRATRWEDGFQWLGDTLLSNFGVNPTWDGREHTSKRLIDAADRLLEKLGDPYAQYYPPEEWTEMTQVAEGGDVAGIGVALHKTPLAEEVDLQKLWPWFLGAQPQKQVSKSATVWLKLTGSPCVCRQMLPAGSLADPVPGPT